MLIDKKDYNEILNDIISIVEKSKTQLIIQANSALNLTFWHIGNRILSEILKNKRAEYGKQIVVTLSRDLEQKLGRSFNEKNLRRMLQFAEKFSDYEIVVTLSRQLSWSHFLVLIPLKTEQERLFYSKLVTENGLGVRELRKQISKKVFERTKNADLQLYDNKTIEKGILKDPYLLDFLELKEGYL